MTITNMYNLLSKSNGRVTLDTGSEVIPVVIDNVEQRSLGRYDNVVRFNCTVCNTAEDYKAPRSNLRIKNVIFNDPATIVFWTDGTKTVVKAYADDFDPEKGLAMAIAKKFFGNQGNYYNEFRKWLPKEEKVEEVETHHPKRSFVYGGPDLVKIRQEIDEQYSEALRKMFGELLS